MDLAMFNVENANLLGKFQPYTAKALARQGIIRYLRGPQTWTYETAKLNRAIRKARAFYRIGFMADGEIVRLFKVNRAVYTYMMAL